MKITYNHEDVIEMIEDARAYLRVNGIRPTKKNIVAQIRAEHGDDVAAMIEKVIE